MIPGSVEGLERQLFRLDELRRSDCRNAISRVASLMGHLVGTPLNVIAGRAALIRANASDPNAVLEDVGRIEKQVEQLTSRLRALIEFLSVPDAPPNESSVGELLTDAIELYEPIARSRGLTLERADSSADDVKVDGSLVFGVLTSLVSLATHESKAGTQIRVGASKMEATGMPQRPGGFVRFSLLTPGLTLRTPHKLDKLELNEAIPSASANRFQVLSVCAALAERSGGRLDVIATGAHAEIFLLWPCS
ncbi:MAG TPA: hypothetical protein VGI10_11065 [Polyangiaceae bacterium]|jgi:signal transduction histidine kinase